MGLPRAQPLLLGEGEILGAGPEYRHPLPLDHIPQHRGRGERGAVVQHHRGAGGEAGDQPVPHHPAAGGEVEDPVVPGQVGVQHQLLQMLEQGSTRAVDHALGKTGRAGGVHDVERMGERQAGRRAGGQAGGLGEPVVPEDGVGNAGEVGAIRQRTARPRPARSPGIRSRTSRTRASESIRLPEYR